MLLFFGQIIVLSSCSGKEQKEKKTATEINEFVILDVNKIIGKSLKTVNNILGEPESVQEFYAPTTGNSLNEIEAIYNDQKFEIIFKQDKASLISIYDTPDLTNDANALQKLGFKNQKPTSIKPNNYTSWKNVEGISLINCFKNHIFIKLHDRQKSE